MLSSLPDLLVNDSSFDPARMWFLFLKVTISWPDEEAEKFWEQGRARKRILRFDRKDNSGRWAHRPLRAVQRSPLLHGP